MKKRILTLLLAVLLCLTVTSCGRDTSAPVMTYGDSVITENVFQYYLSYYKNIYLSTYTDMEDTADYYASMLTEDQTVEEYLFDMTVENVAMTLICMELFDKSGLQLSSAMTGDIEAYIDELIEEYAGGDKKALNAELAKYGVNADMLAEIYENQEKGGFLYDYLYGDSGSMVPTDAEKEAWYQENYSRICHIYINNAYYYPSNEAGFTATDENGNLVTAPMTDEMKAEKAVTIDAIDAALEAGTDFLEVYLTYSEDQYYANGYYLTKDTDFIPEIVDAAFEMEIGEQTKLTTEYGTHYIMRLELDEGAWTSDANADFFDTFENDMYGERFMEYIRASLPEVQIDTERLAAYSVESSPVNYRF